MVIKNRLREIRHELLIDKQLDMAKLLEMTQQQYNRYERQQIQPTLEGALSISEKLKRPVETIFYKEK